MATTTRYSVAKTARTTLMVSMLSLVLWSTVKLKICVMHITTAPDVGGDVSDGPAPDYAQLEPTPDLYTGSFGGGFFLIAIMNTILYNLRPNSPV